MSEIAMPAPVEVKADLGEGGQGTADAERKDQE